MSDRSADYLDGMRDGMTYREDYFRELEIEIERLRAERAVDDIETVAQRLEIERLRGEVKALQETIGEIDRQHEAEIERLRALSQNNAHSWDKIVRERDGLRAALQLVMDNGPNIEAMNAEIERLKAALCWYEERVRELANKERSATYLESVATELVIDGGKRARAALERK